MKRDLVIVTFSIPVPFTFSSTSLNLKMVARAIINYALSPNKRFEEFIDGVLIVVVLSSAILVHYTMVVSGISFKDVFNDLQSQMN